MCCTLNIISCSWSQSWGWWGCLTQEPADIALCPTALRHAELLTASCLRWEVAADLQDSAGTGAAAPTDLPQALEETGKVMHDLEPGSPDPNSSQRDQGRLAANDSKCFGSQQQSDGLLLLTKPDTAKHSLLPLKIFCAVTSMLSVPIQFTSTKER